jgi:hypothetical protein
MIVIPITYIAIVLWVIWLYIDSDNIYFKLLTRIIASVWGVTVAAVGTLPGELYITVNSTGVFALQNFADGFQLLWFFILIIGSIGMLTTILIEFMKFRNNPEANT